MLLAHLALGTRKRRLLERMKTWVSVLCFVVIWGAWNYAFAGAEEQKLLEKVVISDIIYSAECPGSTVDYIDPQNRAVPLRQQLNAQFPREILATQSMALEDVGDYKVVAQWDPENHNVRQLRKLQDTMNRLNIKYLIRLTISCDPQSRRPVTMSASMTSMDEIDQILKCDESTKASIREHNREQKEKGKDHSGAAEKGSTNKDTKNNGGKNQSKKEKQSRQNTGATTDNVRRICNAHHGVFKAIRYSTVEIDREKPLAETFGQVLMHLLHVPEVRFGATWKTADPGEMVSLPFLISINDGTEKGYNGPAANARTYLVEQDVVQLPSDVSQRICEAPEDYWKKLKCRHENPAAKEHCDAADDIPFETKSLINREKIIDASAAKGGERIEFRVVGHPATYLIRAQAVAAEANDRTRKGLDIRSLPVYQCIDVRWRERFWSFSTGFGVANDMKTFLGIDTAEYPAATLSDVAVDITIGLLWPVDLPIWWYPWFPKGRMGVGLGFGYLSGIYPCPTGNLDDCGSVGVFTRRVTSATTLELKYMIEVDLYIWKMLSLTALSDTNVGFDYTSSSPSFEKDGVHFIFGGTAGIGVGWLRANTEGMFSHMMLALQWQTLLRLPGATTAGASYVNALGVPDGLDILWLTLRTNLASR